jgi:phage protein D
LAAAVLDWVAVFAVEVERKKLGRQVLQCCSRFSYDDEEHKHDEASLTFEDIDGTLADHPLLKPGSTVRLRWGYVGQLSPLKVMTIKSLELGYAGHGATVTVKCLDKGHRLGQHVKLHKTPRGLIPMARGLAKAAGLDLANEMARDLAKYSPYTARGIFQRIAPNDSAMKQLREAVYRAGNGVVRVDGTTLRIHSPKVHAPPQQTFTWMGREGRLISVRLKAKTHQDGGKKVQAKAIGIDPHSKRHIEVVADEYTTKGRPVLGGYQYERERGERAFTKDETGHVEAIPSGSKDEAKARAQAARGRAEAAALECEGTVYGDPTLQAHGVIVLRNVGGGLAGKWYLRKLTHEIGPGGYTCRFDARRAGLSRHITRSRASTGKDSPAPNKEPGQKPVSDPQYRSGDGSRAG